MLKVENLSIRFGNKRIMHGTSLHVAPGELVCICGESGCGKSALLRAILGFIDAEGKILIDGKVMSADTAFALRRNIAYVPQELALPHETVAEMVQAVFQLSANSSVRFSTDELFRHWQLLGLDTSLYQHRTNEISGGQRQRMMIAVAGMLGKKLVIADEPTSALDADSTSLVHSYFRHLAQQGAAVLIVSHHAGFASLCDRIITLIRHRD